MKVAVEGIVKGWCCGSDLGWVGKHAEWWIAGDAEGVSCVVKVCYVGEAFGGGDGVWREERRAWGWEWWLRVGCGFVAEAGIGLLVELHIPCGGEGGVEYGSDCATGGVRARRGQAQHADGPDPRADCAGSGPAVFDAGVRGDEEGSRCSGGLAVSHGFSGDNDSRRSKPAGMAMRGVVWCEG